MVVAGGPGAGAATAAAAAGASAAGAGGGCGGDAVQPSKKAIKEIFCKEFQSKQSRMFWLIYLNLHFFLCHMVDR